MIMSKSSPYFTVKLPSEVEADFRELAGKYGNKQELWLVTSAAMSLFMTANEDSRLKAIRSVRELKFREVLARSEGKAVKGMKKGKSSRG